jgi:hypothetical protein
MNDHIDDNSSPENWAKWLPMEEDTELPTHEGLHGGLSPAEPETETLGIASTVEERLASFEKLYGSIPPVNEAELDASIPRLVGRYASTHDGDQWLKYVENGFPVELTFEDYESYRQRALKFVRIRKEWEIVAALQAKNEAEIAAAGLPEYPGEDTDLGKAKRFIGEALTEMSVRYDLPSDFAEAKSFERTMDHWVEGYYQTLGSEERGIPLREVYVSGYWTTYDRGGETALLASLAEIRTQVANFAPIAESWDRKVADQQATAVKIGLWIFITIVAVMLLGFICSHPSGQPTLTPDDPRYHLEHLEDFKGRN